MAELTKTRTFQDWKPIDYNTPWLRARRMSSLHVAKSAYVADVSPSKVPAYYQPTAEPKQIFLHMYTRPVYYNMYTVGSESS